MPRRPTPAAAVPSSEHDTPALPDARDRLCAALTELDYAERRPQPVARAEALARVAAAYQEMAAWREAEWALKQALALSLAFSAPDLAVNLRCELAEVTRALAEEARREGEDGDARAAMERCRDHCFAAVAQAGSVADPHWEVRVLVRVAEVLEHCGDRHDALALQCRALDMMRRHEVGEAGMAPACFTAPQPLM